MKEKVMVDIKLDSCPNEELNNPEFENKLKQIFLNAFEKVYSHDLTEDFKQSLKKMFTTYIERFKKRKDRILFTSQINGNLSGWSLFHRETPEVVVLELICIDPNFWRHGLGRKLVFAIKDLSPNLKKILVFTRKINFMSPSFYESLGFHKTNFIIPEYNPNDWQGYELEF